ncbi:hypothetical protein K505DRAFT_373272 [Melanomma pulvis-pyrius CBS 109.77]|uniref:Uncharacterized protein n=1 Tax=Melanomma pulvis-pyrius CBS 109.77 TaxID=1314802 RepID=A0A6A6XLF2_9PLEO|nr:hypothetical protein K505DRAFT_373272 [Melanomma pulvis-pyrius CBS 109.77]
MKGEASSTFNPKASSFNPAASTFLPTSTTPAVSESRSPPGGVAIANSSLGAFAVGPKENPFQPFFDGYQTQGVELYPSLQTPPRMRAAQAIKNGAAPGQLPTPSTAPPALWAKGLDGGVSFGSPSSGHKADRFTARPMAAASGSVFGVSTEDGLHSLLDARNKFSPLFNKRPDILGGGFTRSARGGMQQSTQFTEAEWQRLGSPTDPVDKHSGVETKIEYVNQLGMSRAPAPGAQSYYLPKINSLPKAPTGRGAEDDWMSTVSDDSDKTIMPTEYLSTFRASPTPHPPAFAPLQTLTTPFSHDLNAPGMSFEPGNNPIGPGPPGTYLPPPGTRTPAFFNHQYNAERYSGNPDPPSTTSSQEHGRGGKNRGRGGRGRKPKGPRMKRSDQGPMPSEADIYPEDAGVGPSARAFTSDFGGAFRDDRGDGTWKSNAEIPTNMATQWNATASVQEDVFHREDMHHQEDIHFHQRMQNQNGMHSHNGHATDPSPYPTNARSTLPVHLMLPIKSAFNLSDYERSLLPSPPPFDTPTNDQPRTTGSRMECSPHPLSPGQKDGSRYGLSFWGIGLGDTWAPPTVEIGSKFRVRPLDHEGWGGKEWARKNGFD